MINMTQLMDLWWSDVLEGGAQLNYPSPDSWAVPAHAKWKTRVPLNELWLDFTQWLRGQPGAIPTLIDPNEHAFYTLVYNITGSVRSTRRTGEKGTIPMAKFDTLKNHQNMHRKTGLTKTPTYARVPVRA